ncbi:MAG: dihydrofolate reductase family protein [Chloroflexota bacterium]
MGTVIFETSVSLDGYVAGPNDNPENGLGDGGEALFAWYQNGDVDFPLPGTDMSFKVSQASADLFKDEWGKLGAMVAGRRMFDIARAWGGYPPGGGPCFIMTHHPPQEWIKPDSPFTFVTDGVESAVAQAKQAAGDKNVSISSASIAQQSIQVGLLDEIVLSVTPVLLNGGVRLFENLGGLRAITLEPIYAVMGKGVTHLKYRIVK